MVYEAKCPQKLKGVGDVIRLKSTTYTLHEQNIMVICLLGCHCHCSPDFKQSCKHRPKYAKQRES